MKTIISAAIIEDSRILLVMHNQRWVLPGGKLEGEESEIECLCREVGEELSGTKLTNIRPYKEFLGRSIRAGYPLKAKVYFADVDGDLGKVSAEVDKLAWIKRDTDYSLSSLTSQIFDSLVKEGYL